MDIEVLCMEREEGRTDVFLIRTQKKPKDPITELKRHYSEREYIGGYYLLDVSIKAVESVIMSWNNYNRSLMGIWHHPSYPDIMDTIKANSEFRFNVPGWCYAEIKDTAFIKYL